MTPGAAPGRSGAGRLHGERTGFTSGRRRWRSGVARPPLCPTWRAASGLQLGRRPGSPDGRPFSPGPAGPTFVAAGHSVGHHAVARHRAGDDGAAPRPDDDSVARRLSPRPRDIRAIVKYFTPVAGTSDLRDDERWSWQAGPFTFEPSAPIDPDFAPRAGYARRGSVGGLCSHTSGPARPSPVAGMTPARATSCP